MWFRNERENCWLPDYMVQMDAAYGPVPGLNGISMFGVSSCCFSLISCKINRPNRDQRDHRRKGDHRRKEDHNRKEDHRQRGERHQGPDHH